MEKYSGQKWKVRLEACICGGQAQIFKTDTKGNIKKEESRKESCYTKKIKRRHEGHQGFDKWLFCTKSKIFER